MIFQPYWHILTGTCHHSVIKVVKHKRFHAWPRYLFGFESMFIYFYKRNITGERGRLCRDWMVVGFTIACTISAYQHYESCEFESRSWRVVLNTTLCDKVCQWLATRRWFTVDTPVSPTSNSDRHDITEILLKVVLNTIALLNGKSRGATTSLNI